MVCDPLKHGEAGGEGGTVSPTPEKQYSVEDVMQIMRNLGIDPRCGACAEIAFCGSTSAVHEHEEA